MAFFGWLSSLFHPVSTSQSVNFFLSINSLIMLDTAKIQVMNHYALLTHAHMVLSTVHVYASLDDDDDPDDLTNDDSSDDDDSSCSS